MLEPRHGVGDVVEVMHDRRAIRGVVVHVGRVLTLVKLDEPQEATIDGGKGAIVEVYKHHHEVFDVEEAT